MTNLEITQPKNYVFLWHFCPTCGTRLIWYNEQKEFLECPNNEAHIKVCFEDD